MKELAGRRFGRLRVLDVFGKDKEGRVLWRCICRCRGLRVASTRDLTTKAVRSCGCLKADVSAEKARTAWVTARRKANARRLAS